jgi:hypothetical protein
LDVWLLMTINEFKNEKPKPIHAPSTSSTI